MSRRFSIVKPEDLWTGPKARELRKHAAEVRELMAYLLTGPTSDRWGIWHLELDTVSLQTGRQAAKILAWFGTLADLDMAHYDMRSQFVYVPDMPESQFARWPLMPGDNNVRHAKRWYAALPRNPFLARWHDRHLTDLFLDREPEICLRREWIERASAEGPSKGPSPDPDPDPVTDTGLDLLGARQLPAKTDRRASSMTKGEIDAAFDKMVKVYPKGDALDAARKALHKLKPTSDLIQQIFAALQWQVRQPDWLKEGAVYAPRLDRYIIGKRWLDKPRQMPHASKSTVDALSSLHEFEPPPDEDEWNGRTQIVSKRR